MAQYVVLIYENESDYATASPATIGEVMDAHNRFTGEYESHGAKLSGQALQGTDTALPSAATSSPTALSSRPRRRSVASI